MELCFSKSLEDETEAKSFLYFANLRHEHFCRKKKYFSLEVILIFQLVKFVVLAAANVSVPLLHS